ncbi:MAG: aminotransferase class I/II-fold pyridoxal phosphate-dependent enzyme [Nitrospirae bacterium]|nr:aminotransferase class I/II-fold pyridoxal phosphate-dependent enzyme [Nitrospirota bacterium]
MNEFFPYSRQSIDDEDIAAVVSVLKSDYLTQGPAVEAFESALASYAGAEYSVVFSSGTAALHAAYFSAGLGRDDELITSPMTFVATSNAALMLGARPVFVDVEPDTGNIDAGLLEQAITPRTKAIVPVHYAGHPVDLSAVHAIAQRHGVLVIEDACHAIGAEYKEHGAGVIGHGSENKEQKSEAGPDWIKIGSCLHSAMAVFSFHPVKPITTGEGGAVLTNDPEIHKRLKQFRTHGITKENFISEPHGDWYYEMQFLGNNYRMTDIQAALGSSQLGKLKVFTEQRRAIAARYDKAFEGSFFFDAPVEKEYARSSYHLYPIRLNNSCRDNKRAIFSRLREKGLGVQVHYIPVYLQPYYQNLGFRKGLCPAAEDFYEREISIPIYQGMSDSDPFVVAERLRSVLEAS